MQALLLLSCVAGVAALCGGLSLRSRKVHAEHWLWKKRRLARARFLLQGGTVLSSVSAIALFLA
jgi:hypothetical protein